MVVGIADEQLLDELFHAMADSTRRDIVRRAMRGDQSVSALARNYSISFAAVQKHVAVLERAGLVTKERSGREQLVQTDIETIRLANQMLEEFEVLWRGRIDRFGEILSEENEGDQG